MRGMTSPLLALALVATCLFVVSCSRRAEPVKAQKTTAQKTHAEIAGKPDLKAKAKDLEQTIVTPHLEQKIAPATNVLWCSTFQLAWNVLCDQTGGTVQMTPTPAIAPILNKKTASKADLDEDSYVAMAGLADEGICQDIRQELARKFEGRASPELLDATPPMAWVAYAYLFKELPFRWAFTRFNSHVDFGGRRVDWFGFHFDGNSDEVKMATQVAVLDYKDDDDLIVELKTQAQEDRLILAKVQPQASLGETIGVVEERIARAKPTQIQDMETLLVPVLDFDILRRYRELEGRPIRTADEDLYRGSIIVAAQSIRFRLDERGAVLKSEGWAALGETPRRFVFDKPFLILMKRREAKHPYFALWVGNAELLVSTQEKPAK